MCALIGIALIAIVACTKYKVKPQTCIGTIGATIVPVLAYVNVITDQRKIWPAFLLCIHLIVGQEFQQHFQFFVTCFSSNIFN